MDLLAKLREVQVTLGETDAAFAARLKVSRVCWRKTREGLLPVGMAVLCGVTQDQKLQHLELDAVMYMRQWRTPRGPRRNARAA